MESKSDVVQEEAVQELVRAIRGRVPVDAAAMLAQEPPERIEAVLRALPQDMALRVAYELPEALRPAAETFGSLEIPVPGHVSELMEPPLGVLQDDTTMAGALDFLVHCPDVGAITYLWVKDAAGKLVGLVVMRDLLLAKPGQKLSEFMLKNPFALTPDLELGEAIRAAVRRHYPVYPVVDKEGRIVGQVRGWRLFERQAIELTAQAGKMVGVTEEQVDTPIREAFFKRHPWLQLNLVTAFLAGFVVSLFEGTITQVVALAAFLPILAGQSGNTGCQALAISLRGLTLGKFDAIPRQQLLVKEAVLGAVNGLGTGLFAAAAMFLYAGSVTSGGGNPLVLALVILLAMIGACTASGVFGVLIPVGLRRLGFDPATASTIFLTTVTDILGMGLMLLLATTLVL